MLKHSKLGNFEIFDAHTHFFSHRFFSLLALQSQKLANLPDAVAEIGKITGLKMPPKDPKQFAAEWVAELDRHQISRAMMMASLPGDEDSVAAAVEAFPDRITGGFFFNPTISDALNRADRAFDELNLKVICLFPAMHCYSVGDDENVRMIARLVAERPGTAIFVHCGALSVGIRTKLGIPSRFDIRKSSPLEVHKLAVEFPEVNFIIPHFGAGLFVETMMAAELCPNIYIDTSSSNRWMEYFPHELTLAGVFNRALKLLGPKRLLFGTDSSFFPRGWNAAILDAQLDALAAVGLSSEEIADILGGNLRRLLGESSNLSQ